MNLQQFDIVLVNLNPVQGSEQQGDSRPCVVLQTNAESNYGKTTLIAPITSNTEKIYPFEVFISKDAKNNLSQDSKIKCNQIRVIDKQRIVKKIGVLSDDYHEKVEYSIQVIFDLFRDFR